MSDQKIDTRIQKSARVTTSGWGRTGNWEYHEGTVTKRREAVVFVLWDGTSFEDEMDLKEVKYIGK